MTTRSVGDEFVILARLLGKDPDIAASAAMALAVKARSALEAPVEIDGQSYSGTASVGVTLYP